MATIRKDNIKRRFAKFNRSWKVYRRNWMGVTGLILLSIIVTLAILGPSITPYESHERSDDIFQPPGNGHLLGTNRFGEDVFTILLDSLRISLLVGVVAGSLTVILGTTIGVTSAYIGGWGDTVIMRITDVILVIPALPVMLLLASIAPLLTSGGDFFIPQWLIIAIVYVVVFWPVSARLIRGQALSLKQRAFITSAKSAGAKNGYIIRKHLLPNVFPLMLTMIITSMRQAILYEAFLAYLGLGDPWNWSLGMMLSVAQNQASLATGAWWMYFPPGIAIALTTLSFAFIGIAFDEIVNPRLRKR
ncbi:MAG: ABC transporter permease [Candidatus Heimdallarchaeaceae archaeon]